MTPVSHQRLGATKAFTLLEVLVSSAVLAIVLAVMFAALSTSLSLWRNTDSKIVADREARAVELMIVRDLASAVVPESPSLWPLVTNQGGVQYLKFLTIAPTDAQPTNEIGDVCYVEYAVVSSTNGPGREVRRLFWPSGQTFSNVIKSGAYPPGNDATTTNFHSLGLYLLPSNKMAARGLGALPEEANDTNFILLGTNSLPFTGTPSSSNYPTAVEINFAVADPDTLNNTNLINTPSYILRNSGLYSFRVPLPRPASIP